MGKEYENNNEFNRTLCIVHYFLKILSTLSSAFIQGYIIFFSLIRILLEQNTTGVLRSTESIQISSILYNCTTLLVERNYNFGLVYSVERKCHSYYRTRNYSSRQIYESSPNPPISQAIAAFNSVSSSNLLAITCIPTGSTFSRS